MPRPFRPMAPYPVEGRWKMTTIRVPEWLRDEVNERAVRQEAEPWVSLMDLMARTQQLPATRIPEYPLAVVRRYGTDLSADGFLTTGQLELGALAARPAPSNKAEDDEAEDDAAAGKKPRRSSRTRPSQQSLHETRAGSLAAVVRKRGGKP